MGDSQAAPIQPRAPRTSLFLSSTSTVTSQRQHHIDNGQATVAMRARTMSIEDGKHVVLGPVSLNYCADRIADLP